tara:strand:+ start:854 stop:1135 length:282 start_codon:yes stop_codon:yes gene_type:complete
MRQVCGYIAHLFAYCGWARFKLRRKSTVANPIDLKSYVAGAKNALNYRGFDDYMVYYTLLSMGIPPSAIEHIGREEREKQGELSGIKENKKDN